MTATTPFLQRAEKLGPLASRYVEVESLPWKPTPCPGIDRKVRLEDPETGLLTPLFPWQPGSELACGHVKVDFATGEARRPEHLTLNPNGHVPVIDDDGFILWESMAINLYLAKKYDAGGLYPGRIEDEARAWQWSFWGVTEVERPVLTAMMNRAIYPESQRDLAAADAAEKTLVQPLGVLDGMLARTAYLLGDHFTVADLNVA